MEYEYRELSKEKIEQLDAKKFVNMYGIVKKFGGGARCVTTPDEKIVFKSIASSHKDIFIDECLLDYNDWYFYVYMYDKSEGHKENGIGVNYYKLNIIENIVNATFDKDKDDAPTEEEVLKVLKDVIPVWNQYNSGRLGVGDQIVTIGVQYKGAIGYAGGNGIVDENTNGGIYQTVECVAHAENS